MYLLECRGGTDKGEDGHRRDTGALAAAFREAGWRCEVLFFTDAGAPRLERMLRRRQRQLRRRQRSMTPTRAAAEGGDNESASDESGAVARQSSSCCACVGVFARVNPGAAYEGATAAALEALLVRLAAAGDGAACACAAALPPGGPGRRRRRRRLAPFVVLPCHPSLMRRLGSKSALVAIRALRCGLGDTVGYASASALRAGLARSLARRGGGGARVIKPVRGSQGEGVWVCEWAARDGSGSPASGSPAPAAPIAAAVAVAVAAATGAEAGAEVGGPAVTGGAVLSAPASAVLRLQSAADNHVEERTLGAFLAECERRYFGHGGGGRSDGGGGGGGGHLFQVVEQRFLPSIRTRGELRLTLVGGCPAEVTLKRPRADDVAAVSAALGSGADYARCATFCNPAAWAGFEDSVPGFEGAVGAFVRRDLPELLRALGLKVGVVADMEEQQQQQQQQEEEEEEEEEELPLLWTADLIHAEDSESDDDGQGRGGSSGRAVVGEFNCSCVGITTQLHLAPIVAAAAIQRCVKRNTARS
jgi:hypothetical protein